MADKTIHQRWEEESEAYETAEDFEWTPEKQAKTDELLDELKEKYSKE